ncbi:MAG: 2-C-methyl-D-erythritol 2,4-cyclodiphosphate synthase [Actinomycetes bacterium]|jgi:2-C-methyl-D-erythritol 2,4-cyclodiphosphate synthase|nr:2-C-methyl-D-erythritol 2,4-cyclodiphosphate synthase [Actinomycetes bacterium]
MNRIGLGYDVHAFADADAGRPLILAGVNVPYARGLAGHSDADVVAHALADALLGAARAGDIGEYFPDTDSTWAGADSLDLLARVAEIVRERGLEPVDADIVIICERPKLAPYRDDMRANLARAMGLDVSAVGLKATTTERLGFTGRGEGIAAQAVVLARCRC